MLEQLFESLSKVRLLKLFLRNQKLKLRISEACVRSQLDARACKVALEKLRKAGILKSYSHTLRRARVYFINPAFTLFEELRNLVLKSSPASKTRIVQRVRGTGRIKLLVLSGVFLKPDRELARTDLLVVGDDVSEKRFKKFLKELEAEMGCEIEYSLLTSDEFRYRHEMLDRFLRDIFEHPHEMLINKMGV
ncbi:MAG: hypothetical protein HYS15_00825 [Candidatus Spechtbacteria bacterium]|nr:hypothetical protein [Candidatus Spechtbacteria bacterium]